MIIELTNGIKLNYEVYGNGERLLLLHGWGVNLHSFDNLIHKLSKKYQIFLVDLPGFGQSSNPPDNFGTKEYANTIEDFLNSFGIEEINVLGHSFGGTVALVLASQTKKVSKLILEDPAITRSKPWQVKFRIFLYKLLKEITPTNLRGKLRRTFSSRDYRDSGPLFSTFIRVINENHKHLLSKIDIPTLIIWGANDKETPLSEARELNKNIKNSRLIILNESGHFPHLDNDDKFLSLVDGFLSSNL